MATFSCIIPLTAQGQIVKYFPQPVSRFRRSHTVVAHFSALTVVVCSLLGCGEPNPLARQAISGSVKFSGAPLESGTIEFSPQPPAIVSSGGLIMEGKYRIEAHQGLPAGEYIVRIMSPLDSAEDEDRPIEPPGPTSGPRQPPPAKERIPASFNTRSKEVITVSADGPNVFDFDIPAR